MSANKNLIHRPDRLQFGLGLPIFNSCYRENCPNTNRQPAQIMLKRSFKPHSSIETMNTQKLKQIALVALSTLVLSACSISAETQAKMDEFNRTIPTCSGEADCSSKWNAALNWVEANSDFAVRGPAEDRINATSNIRSQGGVGVVVTRVASGSGYQLVVDTECFSAYGCPNIWDLQLDFNRSVNGAR